MRGEFVDLNGARVYCYAFGSRGAGEPVVLIHGAFTSSHLWKDLLPCLPDGHRVLVLDLLGHGRSDPPRGHSLSLSQHSERVVQLLGVMGVNRCTLVGHGMGAAIATLIARRYPDRVLRLALVDPTLMARNARDSRLRGRFARLAWSEPIWRRLSPGWLASELHAALLPRYAHRDVGARALDAYMVSYRSRAGRDTACAQLRALKRPSADGDVAGSEIARACPIVVTFGRMLTRSGKRNATRTIALLSDLFSDKVVVEHIAGVAAMAPEEAPDRLGSVIGELLQR